MSQRTWDNTLGLWTCPLCVLTWSDVFNFITSSLHGWGTDETARQGLVERGGFCPCHTEEVRGLSSPQNLCLMYGAMTARALDALETTNEMDAPDAIAHLVTAVDCPACEVRAQSEARHTAELLERLNDETFRERYRASCGLCLPHLANVLHATDDREQRTFLLESQREQVKRLQAHLAGYYEKRTMLRRDEITQAEYAAAKTAVEKFSSMHGQTPQVIVSASMSKEGERVADKDIILNDGQRVFLWVTLHTIEEQLERVERMLAQDEERGITYRLRNPFSPERRAQTQRALTRLKEVLAQFHTDFDLPAQEEDFGRMLRGALSGVWVNLTECRAKYVRAYGAVPERTAKVLDARTEQLLALLDEVRRLVEL